MKKKVLSLVLALLMAASSASAVLADEAIADVEETAVVEEVAEAGQYDKAIAFLANYGIFKGLSADDLGADEDVNRYQMALFVGRVSTGWVDDDKWEDGPENWSEFTDISEGAVANYWGALSYANSKGIIEGYGNGKFGPYDGITYQNALTMVVRTLGYTGLEWPWGYIEKAVSLGLTDGITDVAYTDELTRGETAQIIYNALFAKTKAGDTLAMSSFGIEFGWEKVIVTASDLNTFVKDKTAATLVVDDSKYTVSYKDSNKPAAGVVSFQILNDDGTLADDVYYVAAEDLGLVGHEDDLAVGDAYYVLFEQDKDANLVEVVAYESLLSETIVNAGKTDDDGEDVDYAIEAWLDENTLVNKYTNNAYVNMTKSGKNEVMVFTADNSALKVITGTDYVIAVDMKTGDILLPVDGKDTKGNKWDSEDYDENIAKFTVKYTWHPELKAYYTVEETKSGKLGINWISEAEMEKLFEEYTKHTYDKVYGFDEAATSRLAKSAYAALDLFDTNLDGVADRGIYETYRLGYFTNEAINYDCGHGKLDSYKIVDVDSLAVAVDASEAKNGEGKSDVAEGGLKVREEGVTCKCDKQRAWIVDDSVLVDAVDEDGEETGYYAPAYVIYNYDDETGALKIVKNITDGEDEDSFVAKGVVRGYNVSEKTITIDETPYDINGYSELLGNGFRYADDSTAAKAVYGAYLEGLFNQFVEYVVVDGELVHVKAYGAETTEVIVVDSYAGISKDGYIVVNGYSTTDLKYDQFRLGSVDGWEEGDLYYYLKNYEKFADDDLRGVVFNITSYDKEEDVYFVTFASSYDKEFDVDADDLAPVYIKGDSKNYALRAKGLKDGVKDNAQNRKTAASFTTSNFKMKDTDKYIFVMNRDKDARFAPIFVYEGKLPTTAEIFGDAIKWDDTNRTYVIVNAVVTGMDINFYEAGLVLLADGFKDAADYDKNLLGASDYAVTAFDVLTGNTVTKLASNISLKAGKFYYTQGDYIVNAAEAWNDIYYTVNGSKFTNGMFEENDSYVAVRFDVLADAPADATYAYKRIFDNTANKDYNEEALEEILISFDVFAEDEDKKFRDDKVDSVKYFTLTVDDDDATVKAFDVSDNKGLANFEAFVKKNNYSALDVLVVYNRVNCDAVVYIVVDDTVETKAEAEKTLTKADIASNDFCALDATVNYKETKETADGTTEYTATVTSIQLDLDELTGITHANIWEKKACFGVKGHDLAVTVEATYGGKVYSEEIFTDVVNGVYECEQADGKDCDLVNSVIIPVDAPVGGTGSTYVEVTIEDDAAGISNSYKFDLKVAADGTLSVALVG